MNQSICQHKKEQQHICLEQECLKNSNYQLECLPCLKQQHHHEDCIIHINEILKKAKENKSELQDFIKSQLTYCEKMLNQFYLEKESIQKTFNELITQQFEFHIMEILKYKKVLEEQIQLISEFEVKREKLQKCIEFRLMDLNLYQQQNFVIKTKLEQNFSHFSKIQNFSNLNTILNTEQINTPPSLKQKPLFSKLISYESCSKKGCCNLPKNSFCLEKSCLETNQLKLDCSKCQFKKHIDNGTLMSHQQYFYDSEKLWKTQNSYIDELFIECDQKQQQIEIQSLELQQIINQCQNMMIRKLASFKKLVVDKEKEMVNKLKKLKSTYQKERFEIYKEILTQTDFTRLADIQNLEENFRKIKNEFTQKFEIERDIEESEFLDYWLKGLFLVQGQNILEEQASYSNPIKNYCEDLLQKNQRLELKNNSLVQQIAELEQQIERFEPNPIETLFSERLQQIKNDIAQFKDQSQIDLNKLFDINKQIHQKATDIAIKIQRR